MRSGHSRAPLGVSGHPGLRVAWAGLNDTRVGIRCPIPASLRPAAALRLPGALDGFAVAFRALLANSARWQGGTSDVVRRVAWALGERFDTGIPGLDRLAPDARRVAAAGESALVALGVGARRAAALARVARLEADGSLGLEPGGNAAAVRRQLLQIDGIGDRLATTIVMRALRWPDAFPFTDPALLRAADAADRRALRERASAWRPWRAYAALHLWMDDDALGASTRPSA